MTQSSFGTRSLRQLAHPMVADRLRPLEAAARRSATQITFCVRGVLSPLLSNLVLDELDRELECRGHRFVRYADDCNIYVRSERAGQRGMESISRFIAQKLKRTVI